MKLLKTLITCSICIIQVGFAANENIDYSKDWESPEAMVNALYETISADANVQRNWDRFTQLFFADAKFYVAMNSKKFSGILVTTVPEMIAQTDSVYQSTGFHEIELEKKIKRYGELASVYSKFEVKLSLKDKVPMMKGLNHFQLLYDGDRWWIISNTGAFYDGNINLNEKSDNE